MAKSKYEYVKQQFETNDSVPPFNWMVVRLDGCHFHRFSEIHEFEKPNDMNALRLMNSCAAAMMEHFPDIVFAYGVSDEYSFVFRDIAVLYERRQSKILSLCVSYFTAKYVMLWGHFFGNKELKEPPYFDGRVICYPRARIIRDYLSWRQVDCHINNLYNICFWMLVKSGKTEREAKEALEGTNSAKKNDLLFEQFKINYNDEPPIYRKGSCVYRDKAEVVVKTDENGKEVKRMRSMVVVTHVDIIGPKFWDEHPSILKEDC